MSIKPEFMLSRNGIQMVLYSGLIDAAHEEGLLGIDTELLQIPSDANGNVAICKAVVHMAATNGPRENVYSGIGDASPQNVSRNIAPHLIRMAETRAKARALRDAVNVGAVSLEEMGEDAPNNGPSPKKQTSPPQSNGANVASDASVRYLLKLLSDAGLESETDWSKASQREVSAKIKELSGSSS